MSAFGRKISDLEIDAKSADEAKIQALFEKRPLLSSWGLNFADSVIKQFNKKGALSDKQWAMIAKLEAEKPAAERDVDPAQKTKMIVLSNITPSLEGWARSFSISVQQQFIDRGLLSDKQWAHVDRIVAENAAEANANLTTVQEPKTPARVLFTNVVELLKARRQESFLEPVFAFKLSGGQLVKLKLQGPSQRFPGSVNVTVDGDWIGSITSAGQSMLRHSPFRKELNEILPTINDQFVLDVIAANKDDESGWCCMCGRHLTNPESVAAGIGPVCASRGN